MRYASIFRTFLAWCLAGALVAMAGCRDESASVLAPSPTAAATATLQSDCIEETTADPPINALAHITDAAIIGTVTNVSDPRWNSTDGEPIPDASTDPAPAEPLIYRNITVDVEQELWSNDELQPAVGEDVTFVALGDGTDSGCVVGGAPITIRKNNISGSFTSGEKGLFLLEKRGIYIIDVENDRYAEEDSIRLVGNYLGHWRLTGRSAVNLDRQRSADTDALIRKLKSEKTRGHRPDDKQGRRDPLEG